MRPRIALLRVIRDYLSTSGYSKIEAAELTADRRVVYESRLPGPLAG